MMKLFSFLVFNILLLTPTLVRRELQLSALESILSKFSGKSIQRLLLVRPVAREGCHMHSLRLNGRFCSPLLISCNDFVYSQETLQASYSLLLFLLVVQCVYMLRPLRFFARLSKVLSSAAYPLLACLVSFLF